MIFASYSSDSSLSRGARVNGSLSAVLLDVILRLFQRG